MNPSAPVASGTSVPDSQSQTPSIEVTPIGARPSALGAPDLFTGTVVVEGLFGPNRHSPASGALVNFTPGVRTAWHEHPVGQLLVVTSGQGWIQAWGEDRRELRPGDVARIPPGAKHWHGASATHAMEHIAIQEVRNGSAAHWMEQVADRQYEP